MRPGDEWRATEEAATAPTLCSEFSMNSEISYTRLDKKIAQRCGCTIALQQICKNFTADSKNRAFALRARVLSWVLK
jgi:hypothetical protein